MAFETITPMQAMTMFSPLLAADDRAPAYLNMAIGAHADESFFGNMYPYIMARYALHFLALDIQEEKLLDEIINGGEGEDLIQGALTSRRAGAMAETYADNTAGSKWSTTDPEMSKTIHGLAYQKLIRGYEMPMIAR